MDGANADSDHSMTWEDFFGSTTDLTPTLIGIYDSLLEPSKSLRPEVSLEKAKDARNDPPVAETMTEETKDDATQHDATSSPKDPSKIAGGVKLPIAMVNKSSLYSFRTISDKCGASDEIDKCDLTSSDTVLIKDSKLQRTFKDTKLSESTFDNLSPNVKRMISSATETTTLKFQKKSISVGRSSARHRSNIPLVGATSKISQSGVEILPSVEIYDQPCSKSFGKQRNENESLKTVQAKPDFKLDSQTTYDVPTNNRPAIYDVPSSINKTAFESLSLPYIDQSIELSITSNDREFDIKLSSKDNSPIKPDKSPTTGETPTKIAKTVNGTNSLHRKDFKNDSPSKQLLQTVPYPEAVGSTGNLKALAIPEKEVIRLNPPAVEVSRPLSMSSITSSSSTSSSGVQNKGGVNSAYLASIESLDDHSDADMTSANGSNNFVNNAGIITTGAAQERHSNDVTRGVDEMSGLTQLERVCGEIVQTENVYVEDLRQVVEGYLHIWRKQVTFSDEELLELFNNIEDIYAFNRSLCEELNTCRLDATCIARCFVNNTSGFSVYTSYCTGYPRTMERLAAMASTPQSAREFRERQLELGHPLPLASYLLKPVQRILKYHLLLQNVVKQCASSETEYALLKMTGIAQHIDDMKRRHEHAVRVQEIQSLLYGWNGPDLTTYGELCAEGTFRVLGAKGMRHVFLFDKMLLVTKNREDGILAYKSHIMCNNMMLVESISGAPLSFHVIPWDAPRSQLTLQARSLRHKREWTLLLKRVILENYNAVIPSHARQLVMELGQNKTDDDMLAEKSHSLITQASMRKQLSAPEYLEKRKLDRERRKSFENGIRGRLKKANRKYTVPNSRAESSQECDCTQVSAEKGTDYTCEICYIDLCSDCETEISKAKAKDEKCCRHEDGETNGEKCPECDRSLHYIDSGSAEQLERKQPDCKCSDFKSSQESFSKAMPGSLIKTRGYHSSDNIVGYSENNKSKDNLSDTNNSLVNVRSIPKTCLKCDKIKENIPVTESCSAMLSRKSRCNESEKHKTDTLRSKSKDDPQRSKLSKIGTWRRKSEPGLQQNSIISKKSQDSDSEKNEPRGTEKIEFECRNCGSNKITRKLKTSDGTIISDPELDNRKRLNGHGKLNVEVRMYNTKNIPKKISKLKKNRAKGVRIAPDTTAKFYADFSTDVSTENILHISESNDSLNVDKPKNVAQSLLVPATISKDEDIDEETYKKLIEKTDSFKKNELEKVKYLNKQKVITEGLEGEEKTCENEVTQDEVQESCEEIEQPLEQIISQLLMQNREFQKLLKKQQQKSSAQRRQRLLKSHSNPEYVILSRNTDSIKLKPKYGRQTSENLDFHKPEEDILPPKTNKEVEIFSDDDHIYETLRIESPDVENAKSKLTQSHTHVSRPKRLPSPPNIGQNLPEIIMTNPESDYVYLSFDKLNNRQDADGIYDVPSKSPERVDGTDIADYYVAMEQKRKANSNNENQYDTLVEVCRRKKDVSTTMPNDYLPMSPDQQSPNTPEIWLSRQKEHFNMSRDRKSGSLPRSFQVVVGTEENNLNTFKCKPNSNSKTYLNKDGKVMSTDRPFTIASDKSEISYDDVEAYMSEGDILKFTKSNKGNDSEFTQNISQSTLELEEEIDRCYKNNFEEINLDKNKNENLLTVSQPNLNNSMTSSCEVLAVENNDNKPAEIEVIHPEHKIYKPTSNLLSLRNVLSRFKSRSPNKNSDDSEINANEHSSPDSAKSDVKSPTNEKRSALNPRSYSKNLLQRFKSIIGDEHADGNQNKTEIVKTEVTTEDSQNNVLKSEIKVVITSTDISPTTSLTNSIKNDVMSKSVCEHSTLSESQNEKNNLDALSQSCDNISPKHDSYKPPFEKSVSLITNMTNSIGSTSSPSKSNNSSFQSLNKLPIYMQGSKHLGARIAQSDYVDPMTLACERSALKNVNVLINKNAVRPDSLFSNSSFVTSSSEGAYQDNQNKANVSQTVHEKDKILNAPLQTNSDESFYEKSFEQIEHVTDEDVFRDSAVYSDQEDEDTKTESSNKVSKTITRVESIKREASIRSQKTTVISSVKEKVTSKNLVTITTNKTQYTEKRSEHKRDSIENLKPKIAPPVPVKPKITGVPGFSNYQLKPTGVIKNRTLIKNQTQSCSTESINEKNKNQYTNYKQAVIRSESTPNDKPKTGDDKVKHESKSFEDKGNTLKPPGNIHIKRLSFERASLDSATRKAKTNEIKRTNDPSKMASKSVMERRMEIELLSKNQVVQPGQSKRPAQRPGKPITTKVATFERSLSDGICEGKKVNKNIDRNSVSGNNTPNELAESNELDPKGSWVKQVVNKFQ